MSIHRAIASASNRYEMKPIGDGNDTADDEHEDTFLPDRASFEDPVVSGADKSFMVTKNRSQQATEDNTKSDGIPQKAPSSSSLIVPGFIPGQDDSDNVLDDTSADEAEAEVEVDHIYRLEVQELGRGSRKMSKKKSIANPYEFTMNEKQSEGGPSVDMTKVTKDEIVQMIEHHEVTARRHQAGTIHPNDPRMARWDICILIVLVYTAIVTPLEIAFYDLEINALFFFNRLVDICFVADMVLQFFLAYFDDGQNMYIFSQQRIRRRYLRGFFAIDFISIMPFDLIGLALESDTVTNLRLIRLVRLMRLTKLVNVVRGFRIISRWQSEFGIRFAIISLIKFGLALAAISHWGACLWALVPSIQGEVDAEDNPSWMQHADLVDSDVGTQYMAALYWSAMTVTTIGYGDLPPQTTGERGVAVLSMFIGGAIYAYIIGHICGLVASMDETTLMFNKTMDHLNNYMEEARLPHHLRCEFRHYFMHCKTVFRHNFNQKVLQQMSPGLRGTFANHVHYGLLSQITFFALSKGERLMFLTDIAMALEVGAYPSFEAIVIQNERTETLYIIQKGLAARLGKILSKGKIFGEDIILTRARRHYSVRSLTFINCLILRKKELANILKTGKYPDTVRNIRRAAIRMAMRREFIAYADAVKAAESKSGFRNGAAQRRLSSFKFHRKLERRDLWRTDTKDLSDMKSPSEQAAEHSDNTANDDNNDTARAADHPKNNNDDDDDDDDDDDYDDNPVLRSRNVDGNNGPRFAASWRDDEDTGGTDAEPVYARSGTSTTPVYNASPGPKITFGGINMLHKAVAKLEKNHRKSNAEMKAAFSSLQGQISELMHLVGTMSEAKGLNRNVEKVLTGSNRNPSAAISPASEVVLPILSSGRSDRRSNTSGLKLHLSAADPDHLLAADLASGRSSQNSSVVNSVRFDLQDSVDSSALRRSSDQQPVVHLPHSSRSNSNVTINDNALRVSSNKLKPLDDYS